MLPPFFPAHLQMNAPIHPGHTRITPSPAPCTSPTLRSSPINFSPSSFPSIPVVSSHLPFFPLAFHFLSRLRLRHTNSQSYTSSTGHFSLVLSITFHLFPCFDLLLSQPLKRANHTPWLHQDCAILHTAFPPLCSPFDFPSSSTVLQLLLRHAHCS